ncbi:hypothetical protein [Chitinophaga sancti]|uniref:Lipoprotein n=2 Tax=Chitinophaga sancti TaxID=1004 RepID=A0ABZ0XDF1_9BACT|nr:hypothetical protein [Chitinophaga sancti]WQD65726.1 hypothetical protein U0033_15095 [Chitinophaga sancti]WQG88652.1 hypothetical protein SR876_27375 [Chitinophaga sancti]
MRYFLFIALLTGLLLQNCSQYLISLEYKLNQNYIASVLCVNRDKPDMHCNGKCYLKKQLERDQQQQNNGSAGKEKYEVSYIDDLYSYDLRSYAPSIPLIAYYQSSVPYTPLSDTFRPPQA